MAADRKEVRSGQSLHRALGRTSATFLTAAMIIGTGLFAALGATAEKAGSGLLLAMIFSGLVALATGLSAASVGIHFPEEGGGFTWSRKFGYPTLGFVAGCAYLGKGIVSTVVIALAFAAVVFLAVGAATLGVLGADAMRSGGTQNDTPLLTAGTKAIGRWGLWVVLAAAWLDTLTEAHGDMLTATRVALAMGKAHELPAWLGTIHPGSRSPRHAVIALGVVCSVVALFLNLRPVLAVANVFTLVWYSIVLLDALMLPKGQRLVWPVVSWLGLAGCLALFASLPVWALLTGGGVLAALAGVRRLRPPEERRFSTVTA